MSLALGVGCASVTVPLLTENHPASPSADEVPMPMTKFFISDQSEKVVGKDASTDMSIHLNHSDMGEVGTPYFTCPMHKEIRGVQGGECPICHMALVEKTEESIFTCPMHQDVRGVAGGICPICKMLLVEKSKIGDKK